MHTRIICVCHWSAALQYYVLYIHIPQALPWDGYFYI